MEFRRYTQEECAYKEITENPIILDLTNCKHIFDIHKILKVKFGLPEYYGESPDALWDVLEDIFEEDTIAEIYGFNKLDTETKEDFKVLLEVFDDVKNSSGHFDYKIIS